jgi:hypothetical protein
VTTVKSDRTAAYIVAATAVLLAGFAFVIGGELDGIRTGVMLSLIVIGITAAFGRAAFAGTLPSPFRGSGLLMIMTLFATLAVFSVGWSVLPGATYFDAVRTIAYTAIVAGSALAAQLLPTRSREVLSGIGIAALLICLYSLFSRVMPGLFPDTDSFARLRLPFEYWNAIGVVAVFGLLAALWLGSSRESDEKLVAASYPAGGVFFVALALSQSRGAMLTALICVGLWLLLVPRRLRSCGWLAAVCVIGAGVVAWAYSTVALTQDNVVLSDRKSTGLILGLILLLMVLALGAIGYAIEQRRRSNPLAAAQRRSTGKALLIALAISPFVLLAGIAFGSNDGLSTISNHVSDLVNPSLLAPANSPNRLMQTSSVRARYWNDSFKIWNDHKLHGTGSDSYSVARLPYRKDTLQVRHAHGFVPQVMSDLGTLGLILAIALMVAFLYAALHIAGMAKRAPYYWLDDADEKRLAATGIMLVAFAFGFHSAIDWTWFEPGVAAFGLVAAGWTVGVPLDVASAATAVDHDAVVSDKDRKLRLIRAIGIAFVGIAIAYSVYQPAHAAREVNKGYSQLADGEPLKALKTGENAKGDDPTSPYPYFLIATAQNNLRQTQQADKTLLLIAARQPANPDTWLRLADYRLNNENDPSGAISALQPLFFISSNNERGLALLVQAKQAKTNQLIQQQVEIERRKLKQLVAKFKRQVKKQGGPTAPVGAKAP